MVWTNDQWREYRLENKGKQILYNRLYYQQNKEYTKNLRKPNNEERQLRVYMGQRKFFASIYAYRFMVKMFENEPQKKVYNRIKPTKEDKKLRATIAMRKYLNTQYAYRYMARMFVN